MHAGSHVTLLFDRQLCGYHLTGLSSKFYSPRIRVFTHLKHLGISITMGPNPEVQSFRFRTLMRLSTSHWSQAVRHLSTGSNMSEMSSRLGTSRQSGRTFFPSQIRACFYHRRLLSVSNLLRMSWSPVTFSFATRNAIFGSSSGEEGHCQRHVQGLFREQGSMAALWTNFPRRYSSHGLSHCMTLEPAVAVKHNADSLLGFPQQNA